MKRSALAIRVIEDVAFVGERVEKRRVELGYDTPAELTEVWWARLTELGLGLPGEFRIRNLEWTADPVKREKGANIVRILEWHEVETLADVLGVSVDWLLPPHLRWPVVQLLPLGSPDFARVVGHRLREELQDASELLGWACYLPCSLETPEFMRAHNESTLRRQPSPLPDDLADDIEAAIDAYNEIGAAQQANFVANLGKRNWDFVHMIFRSDLERIALGQGEYSGIPREVRGATLNHLIGLLDDPSARVSLLIAEENDVDDLVLHDLRGDDSRVAVDEKFLFKRDRMGRLTITDDQHLVRGFRLSLDRLRGSTRDPSETVPLLKELVGMCREK